MLVMHGERWPKFAYAKRSGKGVLRVKLHKVKDDKVDGLTLGHAHVDMLDGVSSFSMKKVYCPCGRIMDLDISYFNRRLGLGKPVECVRCRNIRISNEIDELNAHFSGEPETEQDWFVF